MKIAIIGTGYVGLVTGVCFAEMGNDVICIDKNDKVITDLKNGIIPIYEPGLSEMLLRNMKKGSISFAVSLKDGLSSVSVCMIAVGTPMGEDGKADIANVLSVARSIGKNMNREILVVNKSTVPVGTADQVRKIIENELTIRNLDIPFDVVSNPEFLKEGAAIEDFMRPDRVIVGAGSLKSIEMMRDLYSPFTRIYDRFIVMDIRSAEMTKYAANAMLATKISFMNEIASICEKVGADVNKVRIGIGSDSRIGYHFIYPGCGYGGSCFPKDIAALVKTAKEYGYTSRILEAVEAVNIDQKKILVQKVLKRFGQNLCGKTFAVWGLSFKPETDDMREASSTVIISELNELGASIKAYDPKAIKEAKEVYLKHLKNIEYTESKYDALNGCDALIVVTEWKEFRSPDFDEIKKRMKTPIIIDGRNIYRAEKLKEIGFEYHRIGACC